MNRLIRAKVRVKKVNLVLGVDFRDELGRWEVWDKGRGGEVGIVRLSRHAVQVVF